MALYAFDGTWNEDQDGHNQDTNVVKFRDAYLENKDAYFPGPGTRFGFLGKFFGGAFGMGARQRRKKAFDLFQKKYAAGDTAIDIIGFSRGAAIALDFANRIQEEGVVDRATGKKVIPKIRFLGLWDTVPSFGLPKNFLGIPFHDWNIGWKLKVPANVGRCYHALALDERRGSFEPQYTPEHYEVWFRGHHSDVGGGNKNPQRNDIALFWMMKKAQAAGVQLDAAEVTRAANGRDGKAKLVPPVDLQKDKPRRIPSQARMHYTVAQCTVNCPATVPADARAESAADEASP